MAPGQIAVTPIPCGRSSNLNASENIITAAFVVQYGELTVNGVYAAPEATLMICPRIPASTIRRAHKRDPVTAPRTLTATKSAQSSAEWSKKRPAVVYPALFTRTRGIPWCSSTLAKALSHASGSATSNRTGSHTPRDTCTSSAVCSAEAKFRSVAMTFAPPRANARAVARPMPLPAPVMKTTWSRRFISARATSRGPSRRFALTAASSPGSGSAKHGKACR
ncbi:Uncharacterised protein [Mycobacteroides abscessus subsp. abscessus]|nr:Uncharacterised protein [Mycobacteroides abscessus subsp. abscessus]